MKFSMTGQEKCDLLIEMTSWAGLTVFSHSSTDDQYPERNLGVKIGSLLCWQSAQFFLPTCPKVKFRKKFYLFKQILS